METKNKKMEVTWGGTTTPAPRTAADLLIHANEGKWFRVRKSSGVFTGAPYESDVMVAQVAPGEIRLIEASGNRLFNYPSEASQWDVIAVYDAHLTLTAL